MDKQVLLKTSKSLLIINVIFWLFIAFYSYFGTNSHLIIKGLLFLESILYFVGYIGVAKKTKIIYLFSLILAFGNTILSLTDQIDLSDIVSLVLSFITFLSLISVWKSIFTRE